MLEVEALRYRRLERSGWLVHDLSFTLAPGEILGLQGPSGCGKTTLAKLLAGYLRPTGGRIRLAGQEALEQGRNPIQLIFQHPELALNPRWRLGRSLNEGWLPDSATLARFGIQPAWLKRYPHEVSGGELQRLAIVRALIPGLRILICDEITASHDAIAQAQIWRALLDHTRRLEIALLIISHDSSLLAALGAQAMTPWGR